MNSRTPSMPDVQSAVMEAVSRLAASLIVEVCPSADDERLLCVRVFGVPDGTVSAVEDAIIDLSSSIFPEGDFALLPMTKSMEVTREYYPEQFLSLLALRISNEGRCRSSVWWPVADTVCTMDGGDAFVGSLAAALRPRTDDARWDTQDHKSRSAAEAGTLDLAA